MTKKDYILIAEAIVGGCFTAYDQNDPDFYLVDDMDYDIVEAICTSVADALANNNPKFDRERFLAACGVN